MRTRALAGIAWALAAARARSAPHDIVSFVATYETATGRAVIFGNEPANATSTGFPVYLFASGSGMTVHPLTPEYEYTQLMAAKGFVSGIVATSADGAIDCEPMSLTSHDIYSFHGAADNVSASALAVLCGRASADCAAGVAIHGFSLGGMYAALSPRYSTSITATLVSGAGTIVPGYDSCCGINSSWCCDAKGESSGPPGGTTLDCVVDEVLTHYLPRSQRRIIIGEEDGYYSGDDPVYGTLAQLKMSSGLDCGSAKSCYIDGAGYEMPVGQPHAPLNYMGDGLAETHLDWLARAATGAAASPPAPPTPPFLPATAPEQDPLIVQLLWNLIKLIG